ncbi:efflux RND transporter periplasmic adaptor subunit [Marinobacter sp.]|uniref:efflux RND transporter periplasmic adaptor subunit n=1 Tax=Marinobacter sp. TaxID=50741 RepID=UPI0019A85BCD|nr:efflux RND transporter periplasmic adaptor subunit [Marinobacter sp.]MBD3655953.1 efflux RND transporter periplasmic adaptor subunit [Marinobacter sp.]
MNIKTTLAGFLVATTVVTFLAGCRSPASGPQTAAPPVTVRAAEVMVSDADGLPLRFSGVVRATQRATLTFQVSGTLRQRAVELGQTVKAGDLLASVYNPALEPARDSARARRDELQTQYEQAVREWDRSRLLHQRGVVSEQTLEQIAARRDGLRASVATAEAALAEASRLLEESLLRAPFAGRVEALLVEQDEFVAAGQPVMRLSSPDGREVEIRVPAYMVSQVTLGQLLPVWSVQDRQQAPASGAVVEIAQPGAIRGELHPVLVSLPAETLEPGEPVEVGITPRHGQATTVPLLAVMRSDAGAGASVFRVRDGEVRRVPVAVQRVIGERVVVDAGELAAGDQVVYAGLTRIADGDAVEIRQ